MWRTSFDRVLRRAVDQVFSIRTLLVVGYAALAVLLLRGLGHRERSKGPGLSAEVGRVMGRQTPDTVPVLLFVFNPADCPSCLELGERLNPFHLSGAARVRGIRVAGQPGDPEDDRAGGATKFRYPVQTLVKPALLRELVRAGHDTTPIVLLADPRHRITLVVPPLRDPSTHTGAIRLLERGLRHIRELHRRRAAAIGSAARRPVRAVHTSDPSREISQ